ncbi:T9SS type A sorting domain-containing protein [Robertkochia flava]|uniref:T9SS type A sorting domain-containing protein n=1 Tax=Robertkochia flava TaxID=3447986 RepID=UPI001CC9EC42|nr:T9SS type A sorting domain-containing protein [Robertkochia marina]
MKKITTLLIYLLLLPFAFSAPTVNCEESLPQPINVLANPAMEPAPEWSLDYRLLLLSETITQKDAVKVYPNPVNRKDELNISLRGAGKKYLSFYDITGKMVKQVVTEKNAVALSVADLGVGVYILNVKSASLQTTKKVIIR